MTRTQGNSPEEISEEEWETVVEESAEVIQFTTIGQSFVGTYVGQETIEPPNDEPFTRYLFRDKDGELKAANQSYKIQQAMEKGLVEPGDTVRITYVKNVDGSKAGFNPMKDFKVQVRRQVRSAKN